MRCDSRRSWILAVPPLALLMAHGLSCGGDDDGRGSTGGTTPGSDAGVGGGGGSPDGGGSSSLSVRVEPNVTSCVAPCAVFFDATGTTGLAEDDHVGAHFEWDFDVGGVDPSDPHRRTVGFVTAHAYRLPGVYDVDLAVRDLAGESGQASLQITVTAPSGSTLHVADSGRDDGSGEMDDPLATLGEALSRRGPETSILLRRGDAFPVDSVSLSGDEILVVGAYEDPASPSTTRPVIDISTSGTAFSLDQAANYRFMDLHVVANAASTGFGVGSSQRGLFLNVEIEGVRNQEGISFYTFGGEQVAIVDCWIHDFDRYGIYGGGNQQAIIGTRIENYGGDEHGVRTNGGDFIYFAENHIQSELTTKTAYTLRGAGTGSVTTRLVAVGNYAGNPASVSPQNHEENEPISEVLVEGNRFDGAGFVVVAHHVAVRNNLFINAGFSIDTRHPLLPAGFVGRISFDHNAAHFDGPGETSFFHIGDEARDVAVRNNAFQTLTTTEYSRFLTTSMPLTELQVGSNLVHAPNIGSFEPMWVGDQGYTSEQWEALTGSPLLVGDPAFTSTDALHADALRPASSGAGIDQGNDAPVFTDLELQSRPADGDGDGTRAWDMGAYEHHP
ncbi:MAG: PKD domain-containing protein [Deltaproteobacteria bacterium]|jgi:hypothetical protein|nr:PKD domain-containing protein [Deltaproteobacteria bacterium]MBW2532329.1 PKD domain-containing protein [Deltaproteobacteria bacterium]